MDKVNYFIVYYTFALDTRMYDHWHDVLMILFSQATMMSDRGNNLLDSASVATLPQAPTNPNPPAATGSHLIRTSIHSAKEWISGAIRILSAPGAISISVVSSGCTHSRSTTNGSSQSSRIWKEGLLDIISCDIYAVGTVAAGVTIALVLWDKKKARHSHPGPKGYPLLGITSIVQRGR